MIDKDHKLDLKKIEKSLKLFKGKRIVVIGDLMLDNYLWGHVERISPEAPVPIVDVEKHEYRLGGAANVVNNIISLKATPIVVGLVGADNNGDILTELFKKSKVKTDFIIKDKSRPTTVKSRIFASGQQIIRYDHEKRHDITIEIEKKVLQKIDEALQNADALLIEDYNKGLLTPKIITQSIEWANKLKIPVTVDPKFKNFFLYKNCTVFKPNIHELVKNLNLEINGDKELFRAAKELFKKVTPENLVITRGEKGLVIFNKKNDIINIPTFAKEVFDVSGAGDTVISVLTLCLACGLDIKTSAIIANHAAGAVCGKRGIHPATVEDIILSVKYYEVVSGKW